MKVHPLLDKVTGDFIREYLVACGVKEDEVEHYIDPSFDLLDSPELYKDIDKACDLLFNSTGKVGILCDEDNDGICSSALLYMFLLNLNKNVKVFFHDKTKAHGLSSKNTEPVITDIVNFSPEILFVPDASVDIAISKYLVENKINIIILDHHSYNFDASPYAIIVNCLKQSTTNQDASGTLVTDKFCSYYAKKYRKPKQDYTDLVALSLISDVMDLRSLENRYLIKHWIEEGEAIGNT